MTKQITEVGIVIDHPNNIQVSGITGFLTGSKLAGHLILHTMIGSASPNDYVEIPHPGHNIGCYKTIGGKFGQPLTDEPNATCLAMQHMLFDYQKPFKRFFGVRLIVDGDFTPGLMGPSIYTIGSSGAILMIATVKPIDIPEEIGDVHELIPWAMEKEIGVKYEITG